jgi:hypothetical protein
MANPINNTFEATCPSCDRLQEIARSVWGELVFCKFCNWCFVGLPVSADSVIEAREIVTALWPARTSLKPQDERFVTSWMHAFVRRGADVRVGRYRLEHLRRTYCDNKHLVVAARQAA